MAAALWFGFLLACAGSLHFSLNLREAELGQDPRVYYIPKAHHVRPFLLGHEAFAADLVWIRTLGYFADEIVARRGARYLEGLVDFATDLDPRFEKMYIWAGAVTMYGGGGITREKIEASNRILEKGWRFIERDPLGWDHAPDYWLIPQMIGFNYAIELGDKKRGAPYIAQAAKIPGAPELYKTWAATLYKKAGDMEAATRVLEDQLAVEMLQTQLKSVDDAKVRENIELRLRLYYEKVYGKDAARARLEAVLRRLEDLRGLWLGQFPYLDFRLFLALWDEPRERVYDFP